MDSLPNEINIQIMEFVYKCRKETQYVFNKESLDIFKCITTKCENVKLLGKQLCQSCDKKSIWHARMIMNNLLPG